MNRKYFITINLFLSLVSIILLCVGCAGSSVNSKTVQPPEILPQSTFVMDFNDFIQAKSSYNPTQTPAILLVSFFPDRGSVITAPNALGDRTNWVFAALNVGFWNLAGFVGLTIPVAAFTESLKQTPVKQTDGSWIWTYSITVQGITYTAKLNGKYIDSSVQWDMYITKENEYTDFLWYYGESNSGSTQGYWVLKDKPSNPNDLLAFTGIETLPMRQAILNILILFPVEQRMADIFHSLRPKARTLTVLIQSTTKGRMRLLI